jgi:hypothetical protein
VADLLLATMVPLAALRIHTEKLILVQQVFYRFRHNPQDGKHPAEPDNKGERLWLSKESKPLQMRSHF